MDEICVFSERIEVVHYYNYETERKNVRHPLFQIRSHTFSSYSITVQVKVLTAATIS